MKGGYYHDGRFRRTIAVDTMDAQKKQRGGVLTRGLTDDERRFSVLRPCDSASRPGKRFPAPWLPYALPCRRRFLLEFGQFGDGSVDAVARRECGSSGLAPGGLGYWLVHQTWPTPRKRHAARLLKPSIFLRRAG